MAYQLLLLGDTLCPHCKGKLEADNELFRVSVDSMTYAEAWDLALSGDEKRSEARKGYFEQVVTDIIEWRRMKRDRDWSVESLDGYRGIVVEQDLVAALGRLHDVKMFAKFDALTANSSTPAGILRGDLIHVMRLCLKASQKHPDAVWTVMS